MVVLFEGFVSQIVPLRGTAVFRNKLQRLVSRLADGFIEITSGVSFPQTQRLLKASLLSSRKAIGFLLLLKAAAVLNEEEFSRAKKLLERIAEKLKAKLELDSRGQENSASNREASPHTDAINNAGMAPLKSDSAENHGASELGLGGEHAGGAAA